MKKNRCLYYLLPVICAVLGWSGAVLDHHPQQVHIATNCSRQMTVVWNTKEDTRESLVLFGISHNFTSKQVGVRYKLTNGVVVKSSQYVHKVVIDGLKPLTRYYYVVGSVKWGFSDVYSFKTWPEDGASWSPRLAVYGDMGNRNAQSLPRIQLDTEREMYDAILHVGDFAYDMHYQSGKVGDEFMRQIEPIASSVPYMTCPGNHEYAFNFSNYRGRFYMPGDESKQMYYSFTMGPIRFISLDTEALINSLIYGYRPVLEQYKWLETQLKEANLPKNRARYPWVITFGHRPMYCSNTPEKTCMARANPIRIGLPHFGVPGWEQLFYKHGVDVAIWAHEHSYERMWPVYDMKVLNGSTQHPYTNPKAPVHIVTGSAGCQEGEHGFTKDPPAWSAFHSTDYGYTRMQVVNRTHLHIEQVSDGKGGSIIDSFVVVKDTHGSFA